MRLIRGRAQIEQAPGIRWRRHDGLKVAGGSGFGSADWRLETVLD
jgi:hypothetical protein